MIVTVECYINSVFEEKRLDGSNLLKREERRDEGRRDEGTERIGGEKIDREREDVRRLYR